MKTGSSFGSLEAQYQALAHLVEVMKEALIEDTCPTYYLFQILVGQKKGTWDQAEVRKILNMVKGLGQAQKGSTGILKAQNRNKIMREGVLEA